MLSPRAATIAYWIFTLLLVFPMGLGGIADIAQPAQVAEIFEHLGYPAYFGVMLGVGKILGMSVLLAPALPRAKEWAYAGMAIDLVAAMVSHVAVDGVTGDAVLPVVFLGALAASWALRPDSRRLPGPLL